MGGSSSKFDQEKLDEYQYKDLIFDNVVSALPSLDGKVVAITGTTSGLGYALALAAIKKNASRVLLLNRQSERSEKAEQELSAVAGAGTTVETVPLDLMSLDSTRQCASQIQSIVGPLGGLDVLANNAGVMAFRDVRTKDGYEVQMQTNQLSHVLLSHLLYSELEHAAESRGEARVVFHSSSARDMPARNLKPAHFRKCEPNTLGGDDISLLWEGMSGHEGPWGRYHQSKLANSAFAMALHERLQERQSKVKALAADPGLAASNLQVRSVNDGLMGSGFANFVFSGNRGQSAGDGACSIITACFGAESESGDFFHPVNKSKGMPFKSISRGVPVRGGERLTTSTANKRVAWEESVAILGKDFFEK